MNSCDHQSRTPEGCAVCEMKKRVAEHGPVGDGHSTTFLLCPHCQLLVKVAGTPPTVFHELPECDGYLKTPIETYFENLRRVMRAAISN